MSQFVCARITSLAGIDVGLFEFDRHNALYFFVLNADEEIYLRYGGRDSRSATTYLDLDSLELALQQGLEAHKQRKSGEKSKVERPARLLPREIDLLKQRTIARGRCVECHLIDDYRTQQLEIDGKLDKIKDMFRSPDIKTLGIHLDVPRGLVIARTEGPTSELRKGDRIVKIGDQSVLTFGDLQFYYDKTPRDAKQIRLTVEREAAGDEKAKVVEVEITLSHQWWRTDLGFRNWTIEPLVYFRSRALTKKEKQKHGLEAHGFASEVTSISSGSRRGRRGRGGRGGRRRESVKVHDLRVGDIAYSVDGVETDPVADSADLFIILRKKSGSRVTVGVLRQGAKLDVEVRTQRRSFRK